MDYWAEFPRALAEIDPGVAVNIEPNTPTTTG
jgi:hypothetical protein